MSRAVAIEVSHLGKTYEKVRAVDDLSFQVYAGEIFGLLGPNGAGKSTTLRILITLLHPTSGSATILGMDSVKDADRVRKTIGYVPQERAIDRFLTGREHLELLADLYHLSPEDASTRIPQLLKLVELEQQADRPAKTYSGGMKRKVGYRLRTLARSEDPLSRRADARLGCTKPVAHLGSCPGHAGAGHYRRHDHQLSG
jgi:ABC-2 type transport system ATP-binding protein